MTFKGCYELESLGEQPSGRLEIRMIRTQTSMKDSENFEIELFKDEALSLKMAELQSGSFLSGASLNPGLLSEL